MSPGRWVTEEKAKEILEKLDPWLDKRTHRSTSSRSGSMRRWRLYGHSLVLPGSSERSMAQLRSFAAHYPKQVLA